MATNTMSGRSWLGDLSCILPRAATILGATLATFIIYLVSTFIGDVDLVENTGRTIGPGMIIVGTIVPGLVGWGLLALLERRTGNAWTIWRNIALVVLVISFLGPISAENDGARVVLSVMHAFAGAIIIKGFSRTVERR